MSDIDQAGIQVEKLNRTLFEAEVHNPNCTRNTDPDDQTETRTFGSENSALNFIKSKYDEAVKVVKMRSDIIQDSVTTEWHGGHRGGKIAFYVTSNSLMKYGMKLYFSVNEKVLDYTIYP